MTFILLAWLRFSHIVFDNAVRLLNRRVHSSFFLHGILRYISSYRNAFRLLSRLSTAYIFLCSTSSSTHTESESYMYYFVSSFFFFFFFTVVHGTIAALHGHGIILIVLPRVFTIIIRNQYLSFEHAFGVLFSIYHPAAVVVDGRTRSQTHISSIYLLDFINTCCTMTTRESWQLRANLADQT